MFITIEHIKNIGISKFENTWRLLVQVRNPFITFELKVSTQGEWHNLFMLASSSGPNLLRHPWRANSSRLSEPKKSTVFVQCLVSTLLNFFKSPANLHALLVRDITRTLSPRSVITGYCDISEWHVRSVHTRTRVLTLASSLHLINPCAERKGSQPN